MCFYVFVLFFIASAFDLERKLAYT